MITLGVIVDTIYYNYYRYGTEQMPKGTYNGETLPSRFEFDLRVDGLVFHSRRRLGSEASPG